MYSTMLAAVEGSNASRPALTQAIARETEHQAVDPVVLNTHGRRGLRHLALGSVAERMGRLSATPVMTIPAPQVPAPA